MYVCACGFEGKEFQTHWGNSNEELMLKLNWPDQAIGSTSVPDPSSVDKLWLKYIYISVNWAIYHKRYEYI